MSSRNSHINHDSSDSEDSDSWQPKHKPNKVKPIRRRLISDDESELNGVTSGDESEQAGVKSDEEIELAGATSDDSSYTTANNNSTNVVKDSFDVSHVADESSFEFIAQTSSENSDTEAQNQVQDTPKLLNISSSNFTSQKFDEVSDPEHQEAQWSSSNSRDSTQLLSDGDYEKENELPKSPANNQRIPKPGNTTNVGKSQGSSTASGSVLGSIKTSTPKHNNPQTVKSLEMISPHLTAIRPTPTAFLSNIHKSNARADIEQYVADGLMDITTNGVKKFTFRNKNKYQTDANALLGATCNNYDNTVDAFSDDDDLSISANDIFASDPEDNSRDEIDEPVIVLDPKRNQADKSNNSVDIEILTEKLSKIPLGGRSKPPSKTLFLNELPESHVERPRVYAYDPSNQKHQEFYGDVQRTVGKLTEIIERMPSPDEEDSEPLPVGLVQLHNFQRYGLKWLSWREREFPGGGILGDEMGSGKTVMIIGLIMKSKAEGLVEADNGWLNTEEVSRLVPSRATLVVCIPTVLLQWSEEIQSKGKGLSVMIYHGPQRTTSAAVLARHDIVLTTYQTVASDMPNDNDKRQKSKSPLARLQWHRIVLDEAHQIRNQKTKGAQAVCDLVARHRWAVTGTPVHNAPSDFYSIVKFLRLTPFNDAKLWDFWIGMKQVRKNAEANGRLQTLGKALILRREKKNIPELASLPVKNVEIVEITMSEEEVKVYDHLKKFALNMYQNYVQNKEKRDRDLQAAAMSYTAGRRQGQGKQTDGIPTDVKFSHLFALIVRMRQCAVLPYLVATMLEDEEIDENESFDQFKEDHLISKRNPIFSKLYESSKVTRILQDLKKLKDTATQEKRPMDKVVIVSSWTSMLEILHQHIRQMGLSVAYITGKEKMEERLDNTKRFNNNPERPQIILLSLSAGGAGVNLIGGNYVFFVEPHWNPMIELQAQDRVHRIGQKKEVFIRRYITKDTIESRVMELQGNKIDLVDTVLSSTKKSAGTLSAAQMKHLFDF